MSKWWSLRLSVVVFSLIYLVYSLPSYAECSSCAPLVAQAKAISSVPRKATDQQIQDFFSAIANWVPCYCEIQVQVAAVFQGASLKRIQQYFTNHPDRLNDKGLIQLVRFGAIVIDPLASIIATNLSYVKNRELFSCMKSQDPAIKQQLVTAAIANIEKLKGAILSVIAGGDAGVFLQLMDALEQSGSRQSILKLVALTVYARKSGSNDLVTHGWEIIKKKLTTVFIAKNKAITFEYLLLLSLYKSAHGSLPAGCSLQLQTAQHMFSWADSMKNDQTAYYGPAPFESFLEYASHERSKKLVDEVVAQEEACANAGYYTFVHGQRWEFRLLEQWYTWLWESEQSRSAGDYTFIHCRTLKKGKALEKQRLFRKEILKNGRVGRKERDRLLFLNAPFFGNLSNQGSCTSYYAYNNRNVNQCALSLADIFTMFKCSDCYAKYKDELAALEQEHKTLSKRGQVLLIAVPKSIIKETVYCAQPGGYKRTVAVDGKETDDIELILEALRTDASRIGAPDLMEFCLILTDDILTPDCGIKVKSLAMADAEKLRAFDVKARDLFTRMKHDLQECFEQERAVSDCVSRIDELCGKYDGSDASGVKEFANREILAALSDKERQAVKQRLLDDYGKFHKVRSVANGSDQIVASPSGSFVASLSSVSNMLTLHNLITDEVINIPHQYGLLCLSSPYSVAWSPNERYYAFIVYLYKDAKYYALLLLWDTIANTIEQIGGTNQFYEIALSDKYIVCKRDSIIQVYDLETRALAYDLTVNAGDMPHAGIFISADNEYIVSNFDRVVNPESDRGIFCGEPSEPSQAICVWNLNTGACRAHVGALACGVVNFNGKYCVAALQESKAITLIDILSWKEVKRIALAPGESFVKISNESSSLFLLTWLVRGAKREIRGRNIYTGEEKVFRSNQDPIYFNNNVIVTRDGNNQLTIWSCTQNDERHDLICTIFA